MNEWMNEWVIEWSSDRMNDWIEWWNLHEDSGTLNNGDEEVVGVVRGLEVVQAGNERIDQHSALSPPGLSIYR